MNQVCLLVPLFLFLAEYFHSPFKNQFKYYLQERFATPKAGSDAPLLDFMIPFSPLSQLLIYLSLASLEESDYVLIYFQGLAPLFSQDGLSKYLWNELMCLKTIDWV